MYGLIAAAPKPISAAMWCTSRASPVSTTRPTLVRLRSRTRWWCTAETASSDGIGASFSSDSRSDRMMIRAPSAIAAERLRAHLVERGLEPGAILGDRVQAANHLGAQAMPTTVDFHVGVEVDQLGQLVVTQDRLRQR